MTNPGAFCASNRNSRPNTNQFMKFLPSIILLLILATPVGAATGSLKARFHGLDSFTAEFTQILFDANQEKQEEVKGILRVQRPDRFNLEYTEPYYQLYVADGKHLYFYDKDLAQVTIKPQKDLIDNSPAMILSNPERLDALYTVTPQGEDGGLFWYELVPKQEGSHFARIELGFDQRNLRIMELQDSFGQTTRLELHDFRRNPDLDPALFRFTPPAGVDVIRDGP